MRGSCSRGEISLAQIERISIETNAELSPATRASELDVHVAHVDSFLEDLRRPLRTQTRFHRMISLTQTIHQLIAARSRLIARRWRWWRRVLRHLFHAFAQTQRPHVGPNFFDVFET